MIRGAFFTTAVAGAFFDAEPDLSGYVYKTYTQQFDKQADTIREEVFNENMKLIKLLNSDPAKTWVAGPNKFADWTHTEFKALSTGRSHTHNEAPANAAFQSEVKLSDLLLPTRVDWRDKKGVVTPVKNQGQCGSCWTFSATETLESLFAIAHGEDAPILAPQQLVSCCPNPHHCGGAGGCQGGTQEIAFNYTSTIGLTTEANYHYQAQTLTCDQNKIKPEVTNSGYVKLPMNDYTQLISSLAHKGPIAISIDAGSVLWQFYTGGILSSPQCGWVDDHAVQLVGYGEENDVMYWLVRNSWGPDWGEAGYIRIKRFGEGKEPCGLDTDPHAGSACDGDNRNVTHCGMCAILSDSSYPTNVRRADSFVV